MSLERRVRTEEVVLAEEKRTVIQETRKGLSGGALARTAMAMALLVAVPRGQAAAAGVGARGADAYRVVVRAAAHRGASLIPGEREAIEDVLLARAWEAGVVVCRDGKAPDNSPAFTELCAKPAPEVTPFWWDLQIEATRHQEAWVASATLRLALTEGPPRGAPEIFFLGPVVLPSGLADAAIPAEALRSMTASLRSSQPLFGWLQSVTERTGLLHVRPSPAEGTDPPAVEGKERQPAESGVPLPAGASSQEVQAWNAEVLGITDLLIEGHTGQLHEAVERAGRLLREERLPAELATRARQLKEKAETKLASSEAPIPLVEPPPFVPPRVEKSDGERVDATFSARLAVVGKGFGPGPEGQLRLTREGIAFSHKGQDAADWSISWGDLASASRDDGLWESPFTLLLVERSGGKHYLSLTDGRGRYVPGDRLLKAISEGQKAVKHSRGEIALSGRRGKPQGENE
jgi:hypothetical protein